MPISAAIIPNSILMNKTWSMDSVPYISSLALKFAFALCMFTLTSPLSENSLLSGSNCLSCETSCVRTAKRKYVKIVDKFCFSVRATYLPLIYARRRIRFYFCQPLSSNFRMCHFLSLIAIINSWEFPHRKPKRISKIYHLRNGDWYAGENVNTKRLMCASSRGKMSATFATLLIKIITLRYRSPSRMT